MLKMSKVIRIKIMILLEMKIKFYCQIGDLYEPSQTLWVWAWNNTNKLLANAKAPHILLDTDYKIT